MEKIEYQKMYELEDGFWWFKAKRFFIRTILSKITQAKKQILDIGCGTGKNLEMLSSYGSVAGLDISSTALKFCRRRGLKNLKLGSANKLPYKDSSFDLVTVFDVLYHQGIKNDEKVLKDILRILKPNGYIVVTDCAYQWLYGPHDKAMQGRQRYSCSELIKKVTAAGFVVKKASYIFMLTFPLFLLNRLLKKYLNFHSGSDVQDTVSFINSFLILATSFEAKLLKYFNLPYGSSIIILAKKK